MPKNLLSIQVFGAGGSPQLQTKTVTPSSSTQYVYPSSRYDGLSQVTVNGDSNLKAANIKSGTSIFGVTGSYSASPTMITFKPSTYNNNDNQFFYTETSSPIFFSSSYAPIYYWEFNYNIEISSNAVFCMDFSNFFSWNDSWRSCFCYENFDSFGKTYSGYSSNINDVLILYRDSGYKRFSSSWSARIWWGINFSTKKLRIEITKDTYGSYLDTSSSNLSWSFNIIQ